MHLGDVLSLAFALAFVALFFGGCCEKVMDVLLTDGLLYVDEVVLGKRCCKGRNF